MKCICQKFSQYFFDDEQEHRGFDVCSDHIIGLPNNSLSKPTPRDDTYDP